MAFQNFSPGLKLNHISGIQAWESIPLIFCCRYATWLELYARLDSEERGGAGSERLAALTRGMMEHEEGFLDRYRCLSCWDGGMRAAALDREEDGQVGLISMQMVVCFNVFFCQGGRGGLSTSLSTSGFLAAREARQLPERRPSQGFQIA